MKSLKLSSVFPNLDPMDFKIHFARCANGIEPLDEYIEGMDIWKEWNTYSNGKNWFNRKYIFSLINFYPEEDTWLFGGVWEIISRSSRRVNHPYEIKLVSFYTPFMGRLKIYYPYKSRTTRVNMENHFGDMLVKEILAEPYYTDSFPGYKNIDIPFESLQTIYKKNDKEWKTALSIKGIYLITDTKTGKRYVGKADSDGGIWRRWRHYIRNGHAGDVDLERLVNKKGFDYVRKNYKFTLLETITGEEEQLINERESYWKRALLTRKEKFGHNKN